MSWASVGHANTSGIRADPAIRGSPARSSDSSASGRPGVALAVDEQRRRGGDAGAHARRGSRPRCARSTGSERRSASKRSTSSPSRSARAHRCGSSSRPWSANSASCISQKRALQRRPPRRRRRRRQARGWLERTGKCRKRDAQRQLAQPQLERGAERALEVARRRPRGAPLRAPDVVVGADAAGAVPSRGRSGGRERVEDQVGARQVARRVGLVAPLDDAVGADHHERALREAAGVVDAERAARRALGLEVRELLDRRCRAARLNACCDAGRVAGDAVERQRPGRRSRPSSSL